MAVKIQDRNFKELLNSPLTPGVKAEIQHRLKTVNYKPARKARLEAKLFGTARVEATTKATKAKAAKSAKRKGCPVKAVCAEHASKLHAKGTAEWWTEYRNATAWFRAVRDA